jgi:hypothetical protein
MVALQYLHHRHSGMVRQHQTRNLEIPGSCFARPGMTGAKS